MCIRDSLSAEVNWETPWLGGAVLTSITGQRDWQAINGLDLSLIHISEPKRPY